MRGAKHLLTLFGILSIHLASAYGELQSTLIGGFLVDLQLLGAGLFFLLFFGAILFATRKAKLFTNETTRVIVSIILSFFSIYGLTKLGLDFEKIVFDLGIQNVMMRYFPILILILFIYALFKWKVGRVLIVAGITIFSAGLLGMFNEELIYNWEIALLIGAITIIIGFAIKKRKKIKNFITEHKEEKE
ncbi:MAG: hypothetical protein PF542_03140 [Nanoarchaeota archaeon]|jgi:hypothetical protein|nr:hypothetical protein [Nanoarchaeota archaeon]